MRCPSCNARIPDDSVACPECGKKLKRKYKRKDEREFTRRKKKSNGLIVLIIFLCVLLFAGFLLVAVKLLFLDDAARRNASSEIITQETGTDAGEGDLELSGESIVLSGDGELDLDGETLIENPDTGLASAADYDLTEKPEVTLTGLMYMRGSEKEMLLDEAKSFYGKNTTGTKVLVSQVDTIHFASTGSKVSIEDLRAIPNGSKLTCTGNLYIHDDEVFIRLNGIEWQSWEEEPEPDTEDDDW